MGLSRFAPPVPQFLRQFVYHFFYPFSIPLVACMESCQANFVVSALWQLPGGLPARCSWLGAFLANPTSARILHAQLTFLPLHQRHVFPSVILPIMFWVGLILQVLGMMGTPDGVRNEASFLPAWTLRMAIGYQVSRCMVIASACCALRNESHAVTAPASRAAPALPSACAVKYAYLPNKVYRTMMNANYEPSWEYNRQLMLVAAWLDPTRATLHKELAAASARRQIDSARYHITVEHSMRSYTHQLLKEVLSDTKPTQSTDVLDDSRASEPASTRTGAVSPATTSQPAPITVPSKSNPDWAPWERRLLRSGRVAIADMAVAVQTAASKDEYIRPRYAMRMTILVALLVSGLPYFLLGARGNLTNVTTSPTSIVTHVFLFLSTTFNAGSLLAFFTIAVFDYARRAASQVVLTRLAKPLQDSYVTAGVNVLFPFGPARHQAAEHVADQRALSKQMQGLTATPDVGASLSALREASDEEEEGQGSEEGPTAGHTAVMVEKGTGLEPDIEEEAVGLEDGENSAEKLIEAVALSTVGADASSRPPIIDVTRPSNAFAWIRLREVLGDMGLRFQKRMQLYVAVGCLLVILLDISAAASAVGSYVWGQDLGMDLLVLYSSTHTAVVLVVVGTCVLLGAVANAEAAAQAEALMHSQVELEEVSRELQVVAEHRAVVAAGGARGRISSRAGPGTPLTGLGMLGRQPSADTDTSLDDERLPTLHGDSDGASTVGGERSSFNGNAGHNVAKAVAGMGAMQINALLAGLRSAVSSLTTVINALRINQEAHPVRVMGFPATYTLLRLMFVSVFVVISALVGL